MKMLLVRKWLVQVLGSGRSGAQVMAVTKITENKKKTTIWEKRQIKRIYTAWNLKMS